ncbi:MAG: hypothetical protein RR268_01820 [Kiritimatiellia bacterium]
MSPATVEPVVWTLRAPRRYLCYELPDEFVPPETEEAVAHLGETVGDMLGVKALTPMVRKLTSMQWMVVFFHGAERCHRVATYEDGRSGSVAYIPRSAEVILFDCQHHFLYGSSPTMERVTDILAALASCFPERHRAQPFQPVRFNVHQLRLLSAVHRHPTAPASPWKHLTLKSLAWKEAGEDGTVTRQLYPTDGFEAFDFAACDWMPRMVSVGMKLTPPAKDQGYVVELFHQTSLFRATLSPVTLPAVGALLRFSKDVARQEGGRCRHVG